MAGKQIQGTMPTHVASRITDTVCNSHCAEVVFRREMERLRGTDSPITAAELLLAVRLLLVCRSADELTIAGLCVVQRLKTADAALRLGITSRRIDEVLRSLECRLTMAVEALERDRRLGLGLANEPLDFERPTRKHLLGLVGDKEAALLQKIADGNRADSPKNARNSRAMRDCKSLHHVAQSHAQDQHGTAVA
jgi:hypothetical protein